MRLTFTGGREMAASLRALPGFVATKLLLKAVGAGAGVLIKAARLKAPRPAVRRRPRTKRLADSITARVVEKDRSHVVLHVGPRQPYAHLVEKGHQIIPRGKSRKGLEGVSRKDKRLARLLAMPGPWSPQLEAALQSRTRGAAMRSAARRSALLARRARGAKGVVAPRPFMEPALFEARDQIIQRQADVLRQGIEQEMQRLGRNTLRVA